MRSIKNNLWNNIRRFSIRFFLIYFLLSLLVLEGCSHKGIQTQDTIQVKIFYDNVEKDVEIPIGISVKSALDVANITLGNFDEVEPPSHTILKEYCEISIIRVIENFEVEETIIPFTRQTVRNESMPEGQTLIIQPGVNGLQKITYRSLIKNGDVESRTVFKTEIISEASPEIIMVGVQTPFMAVPIEGILAYLSAGNAWIMENNTGNRFPIVNSADLDGRIFSISSDRKWLMYTRKEEGNIGEDINRLWIVDLTVENPEPINLWLRNIIHFADWVPNQKRTISYSTVEPRSAAPGWQANNDLLTIAFDKDGKVIQKKTLVEPNAGGVYGWWGINYAWSPDGGRIAYARPDSIGLVNTTSGILESIVQLIPLQTQSDWAWVPGIAWDNTHKILYTVLHASKSGLSSDEASPLFDLSAIALEEDLIIPLVKQSGMFSYPTLSTPNDQNRVKIAYLQSIFPEQSETSRYRLMVMDRDGSNRTNIFPPDGSPGIEPQNVVWSPDKSSDTSQIAFIYQNNLWLVDSNTGQAQQITGDNLINRVDWK